MLLYTPTKPQMEKKRRALIDSGEEDKEAVQEATES